MHLKSINNITKSKLNSAIELVQWPVDPSIDKQKIDEQVFAIQTTRIAPHQGISQLASPYQYFNLGLHVGDCAEKVQKNRQFLQSILPNNARVQWFDQVHGNHVAVVDELSPQKITADAAVTSSKDICLAIMTADCLPILLASKYGNEIAAIHGGWRPLAANIIDNTLEKMQTPAVDLYTWLGPCISQKYFEVGQEVKTKFIEQDKCFASAFIASVDGKYLADLHQIARLQLAHLGVKQISTLPDCTYSATEKYYSYRKNAVTGRMASLICLV